MGDVLPPKRQTIVDRLRVRLERYRWHHNSCLPRYEQSADALCDKQRQDTIRLKQRFLESKTKKAKNNKSDHHRAAVAARESTPDAQKLIHSKTLKTVGEGSPTNPANDGCTTEDVERPTKAAQPENVPTEPTTEQAQPTTPNFSLPVGSQFSNTNQLPLSQSIQKTNLISEPSLQPKIPVSKNQPLAVSQSQTQTSIIQNQKLSTHIEANSNVQCKQEQEKPSDLCQFKSPTPISVNSDRLSDTFPSIGFPEDSADDVIHPDILKHLIDDVFTNSTDIMKDFNFEDSVGSMKDDEKNDINELVKGSVPISQMPTFHSDNLMFNNHSITQGHAPGAALFVSSSSTTSTSSISSASVTTTSSANNSALYGSRQMLSTYSGVNSMSLPSGLGLDFKLTEPSPAALTLKQMAEQHQNMQQKQHQLGTNMNSNFNVRTQFNIDSFSDSVSNFGGSFLSRPSQRSQSSAVFQSNTYDSRYPGVIPISNNTFNQKSCGVRPNGRIENVRQKLFLQMSQPTVEKEHPSCGSAEQQNFYQGSSNQHTATTQYVGNINSNVQMQMGQNQLIPSTHNTRSLHSISTDVKQPEARQQAYTDMYTYNIPQGNGHMFPLTINQNPAYNAPYGVHPKTSQPPPEYKMHQANLNSSSTLPLTQTELQPSSSYHHQLMINQASQNRTVNQWRSARHQSLSSSDVFQHRNDFENLNCTGAIPSSVHHNTMHHPYRTIDRQVPVSQITSSKVMSSSHSTLHQQSQQVNLQQHSANSGLTHINNIAVVGNSTSQLYNSHQDLNNRQDNTQLNLDFLDQIESSESDLLNFDQVMQDTERTHFQLLDDMEMLSK